MKCEVTKVPLRKPILMGYVNDDFGLQQVVGAGYGALGRMGELLGVIDNWNTKRRQGCVIS